jgi:hypothetical protein
MKNLDRVGNAATVLAVLVASGCEGAPETTTAVPVTPVETLTASPSLPRPLRVDVAGLALVDRFDVGVKEDEDKHGYSVDGQTFAGSKQFELPTSAVHIDSGRAIRGVEAFRAKVVPWSDHVLVKMYDGAAKGQRARVILDDEDLGVWELPSDGQATYAEASFAISGGIIGDRAELIVKLQNADGASDMTSYGYWLFAKPGAGITQPLKTDLADFGVVDYLDVGNVEQEKAHNYVLDGQTFVGANDYVWNATKTSYRETLRATRTAESFELKVTPGRDHVLVKAYDALSKNQKMAVFIDSKPLTEWALPNSPERYGEATLTIPAQAIGDKSKVTLRLEFRGGSIDNNSLGYWLYTKAPPALQAQK